MNRKQAFTIIEILCVIAILSVLAAILFPVFARAKLETKATSAKLNLKGFWQGLMIYQADNDEKTDYGLPEEMGLPPANKGWIDFVNQYTGDHRDGWQTKKQYLPCGSRVDPLADLDGLWYMPAMHMDWGREVVKRQADTVVVFDKNCNDSDTRIMCQFCTKRSIGVTLGGAIKDKVDANWMVFDQRFYQ